MGNSPFLQRTAKYPRVDIRTIFKIVPFLVCCLMQNIRETSTETSSIEIANLLINSTLSTKGAQFSAMDISNFYVHNNLNSYQYMRFKMDMIPQEIIGKNNLKIILHTDRYCYVEVRKDLYGLHKAGYLANIELKRISGLKGYVPSKYIPGLSTYKTRDIVFSLVVDDFGVQYTKREDAEHLLKTIQGRYPVKIDWEPTFYLGITLGFDYTKRTYKMFMPGYVKQVLI